MSKPSFPSFLKLVTLFCVIVLILPTAALAQTGGAGTNVINLRSNANAAAATYASYYVSPTGNDSNPGTIAAPFQTIAKARDVVRTVNASMSGDIYVYLRGGTYNITGPIAFGPQDSGNNGYRIYYQAYSGETPVLNGATRVTGWTQYSGNIYRATLNRSTKLRNLYVNDQRASMTSKTVTARGGYSTYSVTAGQASWAWVSGSKSDGVQYNTSDVPAIASNKDDLEIVNGSTWNENIVTVRDVITSGSFRVLLLQQPYGAIAQTPCCGAAFAPTGTHTIYNAYEFLNSPGQFYFDKTNKWLYYIPRSGENMSTADVQAPVAEQLITITGTSNTSRVKNLTFQGITFANTDWGLTNVGGSRGKSSTQGATTFIAFIASTDWHSTKYEIIDTLPGMITVNNADSIQFLGNVVKHSGNEGISYINDVVNSNIVGNAIMDIAGSGITIGHPQHVYLGDGGTHAKFAPGVEGIATNDTISNNLIFNASAVPGFGGHAGITAFFVDTLRIIYNQIQNTSYNGINLGWGWRNFPDSTTARNNTVSYNRLINTMNRLHDSGAIYTLGQMPGTTINQNYVKGIPPAVGGPTYGLHNDEGSAYITENDSVLDIDPGVTYTINAEDFGAKHDLTILRTYATVNKMGVTPPNSVIDPPIVVSDAVWPVAQYNTVLNSGIQEAYRSIIPSSLLAVQDYVFPASVAVNAGTLLNIRSSGNASNTVWFAPTGTTSFVEGPTMTRAAGTATSIYAPATAGTYKLFVLNSQGTKLGESSARLRVSGNLPTATPTRTPTSTPPSSQQNPIALYPFDGNANDTSGNGRNATLNGGSFVAGKINQAVNLNGSNQYVSLPSGIVSNLSDFSIATWVYLNSSSGWNRVFDFGTGTTANMFLTPQNGSTNAVRFAITTSGGGAEQQITGSSALPTGVWTHVAVTKNGNTGTLYVNGSVVGTNTNMTLSPASLGSTNQNWIGRSQYSGDPYLNGNIDDFRIYNRALSASEVQSLSNSITPTPTPTSTPPPGGELLTNGNAESGTTGWGVFGSGTLAANTSVVHGGAQSLLITGRTASWNGISQDVTSKLTNGKSYTTKVWVRTQSGTPTGKVTLAITANGTTSYIALAQGAVNSSGWTLLSGTATVSWSGTLSSATFYVETTAGTDSFYIDDASVQ